MKKIYLTMAAALMVSSAFNQSVANPNAKRGIAKKLSGSYEVLKKKNVMNTRATNISHWVSFDDAYSLYMGSSPGLVSMSNGPIANDSNVSMLTSQGVDSAFVYGAYSLIDLGGTFYSSTVFNPNVQPFDVAADLTIDSVFTSFTYEKFDNSVVDTAVVRVATPSAGQFASAFAWASPNNTHPTTGDTIFWLQTNYDVVNKKIVNTVAEYKVPLTSAYLSNSNNWIGTDSTRITLNIDANDLISGHGGLLGVEVNVIHGRQLTTADTIGVNANWFAPTYISVDAATPPAYSADDWTCGGILYGFGYFDATAAYFANHWFGNSAAQVTANGDIDPFQSPWVNLKIEQNNTMNAGITELENGAKLFQNYPNPTSDMTTVKYALENASNVSFEVMDVTGKVVVSSFEGNRAQGTHTIELNTASLNAGVYFYSVVVNGNRLTKKMTINK